MKFDPFEEKRISSYDRIVELGNYLEIPAEDGRKPVEKETERE